MKKLVPILIVLIPLAYFLWPGGETWELQNAPASAEKIVCFGDSLVYGVGAGQKSKSYPLVLGRLLDRKVVRMGISGQTAKQALTRLPKLLAHDPTVVVVTLGGNDILRNVSIEETVNSLRILFSEAQAGGAFVVFTALSPPLRGHKRMEAIKELCKELGVLWISDILDGLWGSSQNMSDEIHPNANGYEIVATRIREALAPHLED